MVVELKGAGAASFRQAKAGQFVQIACRDLEKFRQSMPLLRRPLSLSAVRTGSDAMEIAMGPLSSSDAVCFEVIYRIIGPGTEWLSERRQGDWIDVLGPLGNGFSLPRSVDARVVLIGGGIGLPPLFFLADQIKRAGIQSCLGFAGGRDLHHFEGGIHAGYDGENPLAPQLAISHWSRSRTPCNLATDDGSVGYRGSNVQAFAEFLRGDPSWSEAEIYACGPPGMLKAAAMLAEQLGMSCQVCLEAYMSCGIGLCQSCATAVRDPEHPGERGVTKYKLVCTNGPVFDAKTIQWH